ncbi:S-adenosyl-L-methionine-dependent methyltransferases superfamily protein [Tanacetum coccineum]
MNTHHGLISNTHISQLVDIMCYLEQIYPPAFFDIMIHLVIHLPQEALEGGPIPYQWISISKRSVILLDHQELKKVIWYVLHNSLEIDTYLAKFKREFPNQDIKKEFPDWFGPQIRQRYIDKNPSISNKLFALACGPTSTPISVNSCVVISVRFVVHSHDERRTTQNNDICSPGEKDGEMYYGQLEEILEFLGVIMVEDDHDVIHDNNSSDLALSNTLNDLDFATLNIYGQSTDVEEPPDIINVDEDNDFIDDEDGVPHDLADFDDEVLANNDDDDVAVMLATVAWGHGGDGGGDDPSHPPPRPISTGFRDEYGPLKIRFEFNDKGTMLHLGENSARWSNLQHFDLTPHIRSKLWPKIKKGIDQHMAKVYVDNKSALKAKHWTVGPDGTRDVAAIRSRPHVNIKREKQRARSSAGRDPGHWLSSEISIWRSSRLVRGDALAEGSRRQYVDGCALHRGPDNGHGLKGQAAGAHSRGWKGFGRTRQGRHLYQRALRSGGGGDGDEDTGGDEDVDGDEEM